MQDVSQVHAVQDSVAATQSSISSHHHHSLGPLTSARALLFFEGTQPPVPCSTKEESWGPLMDTASAPHLELNHHPFYGTRKPPDRASESVCHPDIRSTFHFTEGGTRPGTRAPGDKRQGHHSQRHSRSWPGPGPHSPSLYWRPSGRGAGQHWSPQTGRAWQSDLFQDQGSVAS